LVADNDGGRGVEQNEGAVRQIEPRQPVNASAVGPADDPLSMELLVHLMRRRQIDLEPLRPGGAVGVVALAPTFRARAMSGGEGDGFVLEVQKRVVMRLPLLMPAASELECAGDPGSLAWKRTISWPSEGCGCPSTRPEADRFDVTVGVTRLRAGVTMSCARPSLVDSRLSSYSRGVEVWQGYQALGLGAWRGPPGYLGLDAARQDTTARQLAALPVLLVEDDDAFAAALTELLEAGGRAKVAGRASDGREGAELAAALRPDVGLMDIVLPVMDGVEATREIRRRQPTTPVVAITGWEYDERALEFPRPPLLRQGQRRLVVGVFGSVLVDPVAKRALLHADLQARDERGHLARRGAMRAPSHANGTNRASEELRRNRSSSTRQLKATRSASASRHRKTRREQPPHSGDRASTAGLGGASSASTRPAAPARPEASHS
jgi:CheY-like chemotaxis protein